MAIFLFSGIIELLGAVAGSYLFATGLRDRRRKSADEGQVPSIDSSKSPVSGRSVNLKRLLPIIVVAVAIGLIGLSAYFRSSVDDLEEVCQGVGTESDVAYGSGEPPFLVKSFTGEQGAYGNQANPGIRSEWQQTERGQDVQLVLCLDRIEVTSLGICPFESQGTRWEVEPFSVRYAATLREAQTAAVVDEAEFFAQSDGCPFFDVYREGSPSPSARYAIQLEGIDAFLEPYVTGSPAESLSGVAPDNVAPLYSGEQLSLSSRPEPFVRKRAFYIEHGFGDETQAADFDYQLSIDGVPQEGLLVVVEDGGVFKITRVFDFPEGLEKGTYFFDSEWVADGDVVLETSWAVTFN